VPFSGAPQYLSAPKGAYFACGSNVFSVLDASNFALCAKFNASFRCTRFFRATRGKTAHLKIKYLAAAG
jgi:hypothetical protein